MKKDNVICNFYISKRFEAINFTRGLNSFIDFELFGISNDEYKVVGNLFLNIFNNFNTIIRTLEESKNYLDEPIYVFFDYIDKNLYNIDKLLSEIITKDLDYYHFNEINDIRATQSSLKNIQKNLEEHKSLLENTTLYNQYYDDLIKGTKERLKILKNQNEINYEMDFLNDLYEEKKDTEKGKKKIQSIIEDIEDDEKQSLKDVRSLDELPSLMDKYISRLINTITNYKYYFDMYYGLLDEDDLKNKDISYFQSLFGIDFEIPRHKIYASYTEYDTFYPLKNLINSLYNEVKNKNEKITNETFYKKILYKTNSLHSNDAVTYIKSYEIYNLKDILNIYFNFFIQEKIHIRKCKNCGKYFIPSSRSDDIYCDNISPQKSDKTCKEYGAKIKYRDEIKSRPLKNEHNKTMQFYRMRVKRAKTEKEKTTLTKKFDKYKESYNKKREQYTKNKLKEQDFIDWIIQQKNI